MRAGLILDEVIEGVRALPACPHYVEQVNEAIYPELLMQESRLGLDPGSHLLLQGRSGFEEDGHTQHRCRAGEHGDVERGKPEGGDPQQPRHDDAAHGWDAGTRKA